MQNLKDLKLNNISASSGCECLYFQIEKSVGIKVYNKTMTARLPTTKDPEIILTSPIWEEVQRQANLMNKLATIKRAPKVYESFIIADEHGFLYPALKLEHIKYQELSLHKEHSRMWKSYHNVTNVLRDVLDAWDLHPGNVVFCETDKRFKVIDFGSVAERSPEYYGKVHDALAKELETPEKRSLLTFFKVFLKLEEK